VSDALDDIESADSTPLDLTPRDTAPRRRASGRQRWIGLAVLIAVVGGLGLVLFEGLTSASVYFYNVDEAVSKKEELGTTRFRIQGNVIAGSVRHDGDRMIFDLKYHGVKVHVVHSGDVPDLFKPAIPVVLEGKFSNGGVYRSDRMLLRHDATYDEKNQGRNRDAQKDAKQST